MCDPELLKNHAQWSKTRIVSCLPQWEAVHRKELTALNSWIDSLFDGYEQQHLFVQLTSTESSKYFTTSFECCMLLVVVVCVWWVGGGCSRKDVRAPTIGGGPGGLLVRAAYTELINRETAKGLKQKLPSRKITARYRSVT